MSSGIALKALQLIRTGKPDTPKENIDFDITEREKDILEHLANGETYSQMAKNLFISVGTVRTHIENIYRKLQVNNKMHAVQKAKDNRIV
jgi:DNA-binding NarL/FixJ family response regulator